MSSTLFLKKTPLLILLSIVALCSLAMSLEPNSLLFFVFPFFIILIFTKFGPSIAFSLVLPVTVLTNFVDQPLSNLPFLENIRAAYIFLISGCFIIYSCMKSEYFKVYKDLKYFYLYLFLLFVSIFFSTDIFKSASFYARTYFFIGILMIFGINLLKEKKARSFFEYTILVLLIMVLLFATLQYLTQSFSIGQEMRNINAINDMTSTITLRIPSFFASSYITSEFYFLLLPFLIPIFLNCSGIKKQFILVLLIYIYLGIIWAQQRSGLVISVIELAGILLLSQENMNFLSFAKSIFKKTIFISLIGAIVLAIVLQTEYGSALFKRIIESFLLDPEEISDAGSMTARILRVHIAWDIFNDYFWFGSGLMTSPFIYPDYGWFWINYDGGAHNLYLHILSETGILGFVGFVLFFFYFFKKNIIDYKMAETKKEKNTYAGFIFFQIAILLDGIFSGILIYPSILFVFFGLAYIYSYGLLRARYATAQA